MRRLVLLAVAATVLVLPEGPAAAPAQEVTLEVREYRNVDLVYTLALSGRIASGAANERVDVLVKECGYDHYRITAGALTTAGGFWAVDVPRQLGRWRARWGDRWSNVVTVRMPINVWVRKVPGRRTWKVFAGRGLTSSRLHGKVVELQRQTAGGRWVRVRQARFRATFTAYEAVFEVPTRGLTLRAFVPARSAAPCLTAGVTRPWRS